MNVKLAKFAAVQLFCAVLAACATSHSATMPESLRVPPTQKIIAQLRGNGVQIYVCQAAKSDPSQFEWSLKEPEADLFTKAGNKIGKHYAGPTWEDNDGSKVLGEVVARSDSPTSGSIPWLLLRATRTVGDGLFSSVVSIQRLNTVGGAAPADGCGQEQQGQTTRVKYSADYLFYGMKR